MEHADIGPQLQAARPTGPASLSKAILTNLHPLSFARAIWEYKFLALGVWALLTAGTVYIVHRLPAVYRSEALIQVESQRIPEKYVSATVNSDLQDRLNMLSERILSYSRLTDLIQKYDLYPLERGRLTREELLNRMRTDISIKPDGGGIGRPGAFRISYQGPNPVVVAHVANEIGNFFIDENYRMREVEAVGTSQFLESQLGDAKKRLERQETALSQYKLQFNGELPEQENALLASLGQAKVQLTGVQDALNRAQQNKTLIEASLASAQTTETSLTQMLHQVSNGGTASIPGSAGLATVLSQPTSPTESDQLEAQLATLRTRYSEDHPDIRRVKAALARAREAEAAQEKLAAASALAAKAGKEQAQPVVPKPINPMVAQTAQSVASTRERVEELKSQLVSVNNEIVSLNKERGNIVQDVEGLQARIGQLPVREQQLASVTRDYETTKTAYQSLLNNKLAADVATEMEKRQKSERFVLLDAAHVPEKPVKPKRELIDAAGCMLALALSMGLAVGLDFRRGVLLGEWELPASLTILSRIPEMSPEAHAPKITGPKPSGPTTLALDGMRAS
jgi:polysaccharide chain length determinant protein (PEP-CTERM system associated)